MQPWTVAPSPWTRRLSALQTLLLSTSEGEQIMVRGCALDSGSLTMDTEIVRITNIVSVYRGGGADNGTRLCPGQWLPHHGYGDCPDLALRLFHLSEQVSIFHTSFPSSLLVLLKSGHKGHKYSGHCFYYFLFFDFVFCWETTWISIPTYRYVVRNFIIIALFVDNNEFCLQYSTVYTAKYLKGTFWYYSFLLTVSLHSDD